MKLRLVIALVAAALSHDAWSNFCDVAGFGSGPGLGFGYNPLGPPFPGLAQGCTAVPETFDNGSGLDVTFSGRALVEGGEVVQGVDALIENGPTQQTGSLQLFLSSITESPWGGTTAGGSGTAQWRGHFQGSVAYPGATTVDASSAFEFSIDVFDDAFQIQTSGHVFCGGATPASLDCLAPAGDVSIVSKSLTAAPGNPDTINIDLTLEGPEFALNDGDQVTVSALAEAHIFTDGFESGDLASWSGAQTLTHGLFPVSPGLTVDLLVTPIPLPGAAPLLLGGIVLLAAQARRAAVG